ncbi:hypothetical protein PVL30_004782 [Lodderomyces elongisporus]|uniref:uncharacterized protein n=1 Tax=Lodderomyces elongisporus TaxID=36914 RepID=UPI00291EDCCD|nr:uncharacterized protein PVL30_004782 [Lodderomyces elongisporus]WLF80988.1 hypothetical protein PVL30_004782 [Lodderomyces elongisporus]
MPFFNKCFQNVFAKDSKPFYFSKKLGSQSPVQESIIPEEAERFLIAEGVRRSTIAGEKRPCKRGDVFKVSLSFQGLRTKFKSFNPKMFQWMKWLQQVNDTDFIQSFVSKQHSVVRIGESAFTSADKKYLIYRVSKEHFEEIESEVANSTTLWEEDLVLPPYLHLFSMKVYDEDRYYTISPVLDNKADRDDFISTRNTCYTNEALSTAHCSRTSWQHIYCIDQDSIMGTIGIPMLAEERENLLLKLSQQTKHLVAQKKTNYKLVIGIVFNEKIRPKIQVWFDAHHRIYKGEGRIKTLFRFGKAKARTPEEYASWLLESLDQHIEVIEGELHPENFEITTPPLTGEPTDLCYRFP